MKGLREGANSKTTLACDPSHYVCATAEYINVFVNRSLDNMVLSLSVCGIGSSCKERLPWHWSILGKVVHLSWVQKILKLSRNPEEENMQEKQKKQDYGISKKNTSHSFHTTLL